MRSIRAAMSVALAASLFVGCGSSSNDTGSRATNASSEKRGTTVEITLSDDGCEPRSILVKAGPVTFKVSNDGSASVTEFEVLEGKQILGEVENVIPGADRSFGLTLKAGEYTTKCPNGEKFDSGTIAVAGTAEAASSDTEAERRAVKAYLTYVKRNADRFEDAVEPFAAAVEAGDEERSKRLFAATREPYEAIEPIAESFGGLDPSIDAREGDVPAAQWTGFHRIEKSAWTGSLAGSATLANRLRSDAALLRKKVGTLTLEPAQIANGAVGLLDEVSVSKITGEEDRYSHTDLSDFAANIDGAKAAFTALRPLLADQSSSDALVTEIDQRFAAVYSALRRHASADPYGNGYALYGTLTPPDTRALSAVVDALAEPLSRVAAAVV